MYWRVFLGNKSYYVPVCLMALALGVGTTLAFWTMVIVKETRNYFYGTMGFIPHIRVIFNNDIKDNNKIIVSSFLENISEIKKFNFGKIIEREFEVDWYDDLEKRWHRSIKRKMMLLGLSVPVPIQKKITFFKKNGEGVERFRAICTSFRPFSIKVEIQKNVFDGISEGQWWLNLRDIFSNKWLSRFWKFSLSYFLQKSESRLIKDNIISVFMPLDTEEMDETERKLTQKKATDLAVKLLAPSFASDIINVLNQKAREKIDYFVYGPASNAVDDQYPPLFMSNTLFDDVFHDEFAFKKIRLNGHDSLFKGECVSPFDYYPSKDSNQNLILLNIRDLWSQMKIFPGRFNLLDIKLVNEKYSRMIKKKLISFFKKREFNQHHYKIFSWQDIVGSRLTIPDHISSGGRALLAFIIFMILVVLISLTLYYYKLIRFNYELLISWGMKKSIPINILFFSINIIGLIIFTAISLVSLYSLNKKLAVNYYQIIEWPTALFLISSLILFSVSLISISIAFVIYKRQMRDKYIDL